MNSITRYGILWRYYPLANVRTVVPPYTEYKRYLSINTLMTRKALKKCVVSGGDAGVLLRVKVRLMESLQTLVRLWRARSAGELLLCPLWVAASPAASSVGVDGSLADHNRKLCCTQWALDALCWFKLHLENHSAERCQ